MCYGGVTAFSVMGRPVVSAAVAPPQMDFRVRLELDAQCALQQVVLDSAQRCTCATRWAFTAFVSSRQGAGIHRRVDREMVARSRRQWIQGLVNPAQRMSDSGHATPLLLDEILYELALGPAQSVGELPQVIVGNGRQPRRDDAFGLWHADIVLRS
ncbi:MAG: hypothetical protein DYG90_13260 [Chloroflexi bacterium CFX6]|nr:hypothetical protein [Chloroflexi bacterium CFX6]